MVWARVVWGGGEARDERGITLEMARGLWQGLRLGALVGSWGEVSMHGGLCLGLGLGGAYSLYIPVCKKGLAPLSA